MKIAHFGPYALAPEGYLRCGIYEAARDMMWVDAQRGHTPIFVDVGAVAHKEREARKVGAVDNRGGFRVVVQDYDAALDADLFVAHDVIPDEVITRSQAPIVFIMHGRPLDSFRPEIKYGRGSYSFIFDYSRAERVKAMVTFWPDHVPYWRVLVPEEKLFCIPDPVVDQTRYRPEGEVHAIDPTQRGDFNILIADAWREDIDCYEIVHAPMEAAKDIPGLKVHVYCVEMPVPHCWELIFHRLRTLGILGEVWARAPYMDRVYRSMDCVLTPHRIATRIVAEALSCGTPVVAAAGCRYTPYTGNVADAEDMARALVRLYHDWRRSRGDVRAMASTASLAFDPLAFGERRAAVYRQALEGGEP